MKSNYRILPLGGLGEIGMNMMVLQRGRDAVVIDCGVTFGDSHLPGIELVVPDYSYVVSNEVDLRAVILTHGHEDHIGALPFLLREKNVPVYGSRFTLALVKERLREHGLLQNAKLHLVKEGDQLDIGGFVTEFLCMSHSIADALALAIETPLGYFVHTGDFKIDPKPVDGRMTDLKRFRALGDKGVFLLLSDSTNVEVPGSSISESSVRKGLAELMHKAPGWIILASFASHIPRLRQATELALEEGRKILLAGRSMITNVGLSRDLGYLKLKDSDIVDLDQAIKLPRNKLMILSTGCQGEPRSALARMAFDQHKELKIEPDDRVILSSRFIPGNERAIFAIVNHLYRRGAEVHTTMGADVHVSGHAYKEDLRQMLEAARPKYFIPVHGEYRHLVKHIQLACETGVKEAHAILLEDGDGVDFADGNARRMPRMDLHRSVVDGREIGDIASAVLRDRRHLSEGGIVVVVVILDAHSGEVVRGPELFAKGFAFEEVEDKILTEARQALLEHLEDLTDEARTDEVEVQEEIRLAARRFFKGKLDRKPVVIPVVMEV